MVDSARDVAEGFLSAFAAGDFDAMVSYCAPGVRSLDYSASASGIRGEYEGAEGLAQELERFDAALEATSFEVLEVIAEGNTAVARSRLGLVSKRNGEPYVGPLLTVFEVADGKITLMETFPTEPESLYLDT